MVFFLIPKSTPLSSLIEAYCARQRLDTRYTRFTQQGTEALSETKNMGELGAKASKFLSFNAQSLVFLSGGSNAPILTDWRALPDLGMNECNVSRESIFGRMFGQNYFQHATQTKMSRLWKMLISVFSF